MSDDEIERRIDRIIGTTKERSLAVARRRMTALDLRALLLALRRAEARTTAAEQERDEARAKAERYRDLIGVRAALDAQQDDLA